MQAVNTVQANNMKIESRINVEDKKKVRRTPTHMTGTGKMNARRADAVASTNIISI